VKTSTRTDAPLTARRNGIGTPLRPDARAAGLAAVVAMLVGCDPGHDELQAWMEQQRREVRPSVQPLEPPKPFDPAPYAPFDVADPFSTQKMTVALRVEARAASSLLANELNRRRGPLEAFPLDNMRMVGSVEREGQPTALLRVGELLYQVTVGDYLGQNYGRVLRIDETELVLREVVQDAAGEWIERPASLQLQEGGAR
jgi:type IV pilus assembly protein PilP